MGVSRSPNREYELAKRKWGLRHFAGYRAVAYVPLASVPGGVHPVELRDRAVRMVFEATAAPGSHFQVLDVADPAWLPLSV